MNDRAVRIAGASGSAADRRHAIATLARNFPHDPIDVIVGDWLSEANMTAQAARKAAAEPAYEASFLDALAPALDDIARHQIRVVVNAGGADVEGLHVAVLQLLRSRGVQLQVAWIAGDDVMAAVRERLVLGGPDGEFRNLCTGERLVDWRFEPLAAQAYLGGGGIAAALAHGAQVVLCGRVSDASLVVGAASWWHGWRADDDDAHDALANALVAGHLIECSTYVCGGNFTGFQHLPDGWRDMGFPIAEIARSGHSVITKQRNTGGAVTVDTCSAQLLYEIQGPWYFNADVTARLDDISLEQLGPNRVAVHGVQGSPPPPTTKIGLTAHGGHQAEIHWFLVGLDLAAKARMLEQQIRDVLDVSQYHVLTFTSCGRAAENPTDQNSATVDFRVLAQARAVEALMPATFLTPIVNLVMSAYPGATPHLDLRLGVPKPICEYFVTLLPQADIQHVAHLPDGRALPIPPPRTVEVYPPQPSSPASLQPSRDFGPTVRGPLGWCVHARSGDKGSDANVGFWVRSAEEFEWARELLSVETVKALLADEYTGNRIDRWEFPHLRAVHFLLHNHLDRGVSCSASYDVLAKNLAEYLRARYVDLPRRFLHQRKL